MKKLIPAMVAMLLALVLAPASSTASGESVELTMSAKPVSGPLYREVPRPVDAGLKITVVPASPLAPTVTPLKVSTIRFPADMYFDPDPKVTPTCPASKIGPETNLSLGTAAIVDLCPESVVGTGRASIYLGQFQVSKLDDPQLVVFNAGRDSKGQPKVTIYGFSKSVTAGVLMNGVLARDGRLEIQVGVLPVDSSVAEFTLGIPGEPLEVEDPASPAGTRLIEGLDPTYLEAKCSRDLWIARGDFVLGARDGSTGEPIGEETLVSSNPFSLGCVGRKGTPRVSAKSVKGPARVKSGRKANFTIRIANRGTASARAVRIRADGAVGKATVDRIAPGTTKNVKVKAKVSGRSGSRKRIVFNITAGKKRVGKAIATVQIG